MYKCSKELFSQITNADVPNFVKIWGGDVTFVFKMPIWHGVTQMTNVWNQSIK